MRPPRPGISWSRGRVRRRAFYATYMDSPAWRKRRTRWHAEWMDKFRAEPWCLGCGAVWSLREGDLHHRTYDRLGAEVFTDLIPLCRQCHTRLHDIWDASAEWRKMGRSAATSGILTTIRRTNTRPTEDDR